MEVCYDCECDNAAYIKCFAQGKLLVHEVVAIKMSRKVKV